MNELFLPEEAFPLIERDGAIFFPYVPVHHKVKQFAKENGYEVFDKIETIGDSFYEATERDLVAKLGDSEGQRLVTFVRECPNPWSIFGRIDPKDHKLYLINGVFSVNCDSTEMIEKLTDAKYDHWGDNIGSENVDRLNNLLLNYIDDNGDITFVMSHNTRAGTLDPILHKNWALTFNNSVLEYLHR